MGRMPGISLGVVIETWDMMSFISVSGIRRCRILDFNVSLSRSSTFLLWSQ